MQTWRLGLVEENVQKDCGGSRRFIEAIETDWHLNAVSYFVMRILHIRHYGRSIDSTSENVPWALVIPSRKNTVDIPKFGWASSGDGKRIKKPLAKFPQRKRTGSAFILFLPRRRSDGHGENIGRKETWRTVKTVFRTLLSRTEHRYMYFDLPEKKMGFLFVY